MLKYRLVQIELRFALKHQFLACVALCPVLCYTEEQCRIGNILCLFELGHCNSLLTLERHYHAVEAEAVAVREARCH